MPRTPQTTNALTPNISSAEAEKLDLDPQLGATHRSLELSFPVEELHVVI